MEKDLWRRCLAEAIGTFFLCFIGIGAILAQEGGARIGVL
jgi:glycerol uptake facilitator-like aquaporin